jgi:hypothetical protein
MSPIAWGLPYLAGTAGAFAVAQGARVDGLGRHNQTQIGTHFKANGEQFVEYLIGVVLGLVVCVFATVVGFDRDRAFYPTLVPVFATYYILFAVIGGSMPALLLESLVSGAFFALAAAGFKTNLWLIVATLAGHGVFDYFHHLLIHNPGVPVWWPGFCLSIDVLAGGFLALLLMRRSGFAAKA